MIPSQLLTDQRVDACAALRLSVLCITDADQPVGFGVVRIYFDSTPRGLEQTLIRLEFGHTGDLGLACHIVHEGEPTLGQRNFGV